MEMDEGEMDSDIEFKSDSEDESFVPPSEVSRKSLQGDALRNLRKQVDYSLSSSAFTFYESNLNQPQEPDMPPPSQLNRKLTLQEGFLFARQRLNRIGFELSKSQRNTKGDG